MTLSMSRPIRIAVVAGLAIGVASCASAQRLWPFGGDNTPQATASAGVRIPILEAEQNLAPSAALSGRDFVLPAAQPVTSSPLPGRVADQSAIHAAAAADFAVAWRRNAGAGSSRTTQVTAPVVAEGGRLFLLDGASSVSAVDAATGAVAWRTDIRPQGGDSNAFGGGLAVAGGKVFVVSGYRVAVALDQATGRQLWSQPLASPVHGAPTIVGTRAYAIDVDNQLIAFDLNTGEPIWTFQGISEPARVLRAASPAVTGETVIAPFSSGELVAVRASNGQQVWQQVLSRTSRTNALSEIRDIAGRPVVSGGSVYAISHSGVLAAVDVRTGQARWTLPIAGVNAPLAIGEVVYVVSNAGVLTVINQASGQVYWSRNLNEGRERRKRGFFGIGARTLRPQWSGPVLASNRLVLVNSFGEAVALDPKTGAEQGSLSLGGPAYQAPVAYNGMLYVLTDEAQLVAIR